MGDGIMGDGIMGDDGMGNKRHGRLQRRVWAQEAYRHGDADVARRAGVTLGTVLRWRTEFGLTADDKPHTAADVADVMSAVGAGVSREPADRVYDVSVDLVPFGGVHTGEAEARGGAVCDCGGFDCPGVYGGLCEYDDPDAAFCPCGCRNAVSYMHNESYAYDRFGDCLADPDDPECLAAEYPSANARMFAGQEALADGTVDIADFAVTVTDTADGHGTHGAEVYYRGELIAASRAYEGDTYWTHGEAVAKAHGYMFHHAYAEARAAQDFADEAEFHYAYAERDVI